VDGVRFDAWTRRRLGLVTGGAVLSLLASEDGEAKKKRRKEKRCKKSEKRCGKRCVKGTCCIGRSCGEACECGRTVEGDTFCFDADEIILCTQCESSAQCNEGFRCIERNCGPAIAVCMPPCRD
jgi:hypothetical protein